MKVLDISLRFTAFRVSAAADGTPADLSGRVLLEDPTSEAHSQAIGETPKSRLKKDDENA